jgi:hypothetical protein
MRDIKPAWPTLVVIALLGILLHSSSACAESVRAATPRASSTTTTTILPAGRHLARVLDGLDVEAHWLPGDPIDWRTGEYDPDARPLAGHCSAFVAAACAALDIYILRPPDHREYLLANAQCEWLRTVGPSQGWEPVPDGRTAQRMANRGNVVVVCYKNSDRENAGHIAIVRPSRKVRAAVDADGPDITQAGKRNYTRTNAKNGFRLHANAWRKGRMLYYAHATRFQEGRQAGSR